MIPIFYRKYFRICQKPAHVRCFTTSRGAEPDSEEQLESDLGTMNLFVLVVTTDFLFQPCFANKEILDFAAKHAIAVLPILFEGGLEEAFNEKIGNLQCLAAELKKPGSVYRLDGDIEERW